MFDQIAISLKTFLRDEHLFHAVKGIEENLPGAQIIIADDGNMSKEKGTFYEYLENKGHKVYVMPFDSGFGVKSNRIAANLERPYLLVGSDDFDFDWKATIGIDVLCHAMKWEEQYDIISGRVNERPYEFNLEINGGIVREIPVKPKTLSLVECDVTVNYSLIRAKVFEKIRWDNDVHIGGGEHGAFFYDIKKAEFKVACIPYVNINEQERANSIEYRKYRARALSPERPCFVKRGITKWTLGTGEVDYEKK